MATLFDPTQGGTPSIGQPVLIATSVDGRNEIQIYNWAGNVPYGYRMVTQTEGARLANQNLNQYDDNISRALGVGGTYERATQDTKNFIDKMNAEKAQYQGTINDLVNGTGMYAPTTNPTLDKFIEGAPSATAAYFKPEYVAKVLADTGVLPFSNSTEEAAWRQTMQQKGIDVSGYTNKANMIQIAPGKYVPAGSAADPSSPGYQGSATYANQNQTGTSAAPAAGGTGAPTSALQPGATGADVVALQKYLVSKGYMTQAQMDTGPGTYGPQTTAAVLAMQKSLGVDTSTGPGTYGPQTIAAVQASGGSAGGAAAGSPPAAGPLGGLPSTGNQTLDSILSGLQKYVTDTLGKGFQVNPDLQITPDLVNKFLGEAHSQVDPYYQQQLTSEIAGINASLDNLATNYGIEQGGAQAQFRQGLADSREAAGGAGTAFSGGRGLNEQNMLASQGRSLGALDTKYSTAIGATLRNAGNEIGMGIPGLTGDLSQFHIPTLASQGSTLEGARGGATGGNPLSFGYDPSTYQFGTLPGKYATDLTNQSNQFLSNYLKSSGNNSARSFLNLNGVPTLT